MEEENLEYKKNPPKRDNRTELTKRTQSGQAAMAEPTMMLKRQREKNLKTTRKGANVNFEEKTPVHERKARKSKQK